MLLPHWPARAAPCSTRNDASHVLVAARPPRAASALPEPPQCLYIPGSSSAILSVRPPAAAAVPRAAAREAAMEGRMQANERQLPDGRVELADLSPIAAS